MDGDRSERDSIRLLFAESTNVAGRTLKQLFSLSVPFAINYQSPLSLSLSRFSAILTLERDGIESAKATPVGVPGCATVCCTAPECAAATRRIIKGRRNRYSNDDGKKHCCAEMMSPLPLCRKHVIKILQQKLADRNGKKNSFPFQKNTHKHTN